MEGDHRACDAVFAAAEAAVSQADWDEARREFARFRGAMLQHFDREEQVLFPAFEAATGMAGGPTAVMREEHEQIRGVLDQLDAALAEGDSERFLGFAETLAILIQQHNMKEEQVLYPTSDQVIPAPGDVVGAMQAIDAS